MTRIGLQLHTLREIGDPLPELLEQVGRHGYDGVEFAHKIHDTDVSTIATALDDSDLDPIAGHVTLSHLESNFSDLVDLYGAVGCTTLVLPHLHAKWFLSFQRLDTLASRLTDLAQRLDARGFSLVVHNTRPMHSPVVARGGLSQLVESNYVPGGGWQQLANGANHLLPKRLHGTTGFEYLLKVTAGSGIEFEIDVEHAVSTDRDPHQLFSTVGDRLFAVHISDGLRLRRFPPAHRSTPLGEGDVDIEREVQSAIEHGAPWLIGEVDDHPDPSGASEEIIRTIRASHPSLERRRFEMLVD